jgi:tetratricopeptide (TPR) repeat protein
LKSTTLYIVFIGGLLLILSACSTKKDKFLNRNFQALNTKYNVLFNGDLALEQGKIELKETYRDNFWEVLPIERMQLTEEDIEPGDTRNPNFERAEEKSIKAIQRRSMLIGGVERNYQIDEAYLLLGKSRYYDQRFVPALEAFNYILYKYPESDKIYEAKIWREKTNIRLESEALAINNLKKLMAEIKFKEEIYADANAIIAQAYWNLEQKDSAIARLKKATFHTKLEEEKARYRFITGQMFEEINKQDSAFKYYQKVIDMKRKSPRRYIIQAHVRQAKQFDYKNGDTIAFLEKFNKLIDDRENRPFLDVLHHQKALFYDNQDKDKDAIVNYNKSLRQQSEDPYLIASNYRNLAEIYFDQAKYQRAGNYYDSTLVFMTDRTKEQKSIQKKRDNLDDVIRYEGVAQRNDSILNIVALPEIERIAFFQSHIDKLKLKEEELQKKQAKEAKAKGSQREDFMGNDAVFEDKSNRSLPAPGMASANSKSGSFYFYNPATVAQGKKEFQNQWGNRTAGTYWRNQKARPGDVKPDFDEMDEEDPADAFAKKGELEEKLDVPEISVDTYLSQLPTTLKEKDSITKERNFAYYQLGMIYKEKFKEYQLAADRFEILLRSKPKERLLLPAMYHLYRTYEIINSSKALAMKDKIISQFPESRYAQLISKGNVDALAENDPNIYYAKLYKQHNKGDYREVWFKTIEAIDIYTGEEVVPKLEMLKAILAGKLFGLQEYKKGLNEIALNYPNVEEGKRAEKLITYQIPPLENLDFYQTVPNSFKIVYFAPHPLDKKSEEVKIIVEKYLKERGQDGLYVTVDIYKMSENFIVIHGLRDEENARGVASILKEYKDYKVTAPAIVISSEDYKVVQIKKNLEDYLNPDYVPKEKKTFASEPEEVIAQTNKPIQKPSTPAKGSTKPETKIIGNTPARGTLPTTTDQKGNQQGQTRNNMSQPGNSMSPPGSNMNPPGSNMNPPGMPAGNPRKP